MFSVNELQVPFPSLTPMAVQKRLARAVKRGAVRRLRRDLYAAVPCDVAPDSFKPDRFQVLAAAKPGAVFCGHSALELLGVAYSVWNECTAYTDQRRERFHVGDTRFVLLGHPSALTRLGLADLGVRSFDRAGVPVKGLGPERVVVEGFRSPRSFGGLMEFVASASSVQLFDWRLVMEVLRAFETKKLYGAVGWFLESNQGRLEVPTQLLDELAANVPRVPVYLDRDMGAGTKARRWNVLVPDRLARMEESHAAQF